MPLTITQGSLSTTVNVRIQPVAPALFTTNAQGTGQGSVLIAGTASMAAPAGRVSRVASGEGGRVYFDLLHGAG